VPVVLDADVIIAGTLASTGACHDIVDAWLGGDFEVAVCPLLIAEVRKTLRHPRIAGRYQLDLVDVEAWVARLGNEGLRFDDPKDPPRRVPDDPGDDYLIELAMISQASALITRDRHLARAQIPADLGLLSPAAFAEALRRQERRPPHR
jgi:putative PIN family toxin of toxin-antitoxin system